MSTTLPNLKLVQPARSEKYLVTVFNDNAKKIDDAYLVLKNKDTSLQTQITENKESAEQGIADALSSAKTYSDNALSQHNASATAHPGLRQTLDAHEEAIVDIWNKDTAQDQRLTALEDNIAVTDAAIQNVQNVAEEASRVSEQAMALTPKIQDVENMIDASIEEHNNNESAHPYILSLIRDISEIGGIQSDWNVNNPSEASYIKNRPFFSYIQTTDIVTPTAAVPTKDTRHDETTGKYITEFDFNEANPFVGNSRYLVVINGEKHLVILTTTTQATVTTDDASYVISRVKDDGADTYHVHVVETTDLARSYLDEFGIIQKEELVNQLDKKYLPGDYVSDEVARLIADAPADFDTLKEISDWITDHSSDAAEMNTAINTLKTNSVKTITASGKTVTYKNAAGTTLGTFTTQDTWKANDITTPGYVPAPTASKTHYFYSTDDDGNPAWRNNVTAAYNYAGLLSADGYRRIYNRSLSDGALVTDNARKFYATDANGAPGWRKDNSIVVDYDRHGLITNTMYAQLFNKSTSDGKNVTSNANLVWKTNGLGVPGWYSDDNTTYSNASYNTNGLFSASNFRTLFNRNSTDGGPNTDVTNCFWCVDASGAYGWRSAGAVATTEHYGLMSPNMLTKLNGIDTGAKVSGITSITAGEDTLASTAWTGNPTVLTSYTANTNGKYLVMMTASTYSTTTTSGSLSGVIHTESSSMGRSPSVAAFGGQGATVFSFYAYTVTEPTTFYALAKQNSGSSQTVHWNFGVFRLA